MVILLFVFSAGWLTMLAVRVLPGVRQDAFDVSCLTTCRLAELRCVHPH